MKYCPNCANTLEDSAVFCDKCGTRLQAQSTPQPGYAQQPYSYGANQPQYQPGTPSANKKTPVLQILLICLGGVLALILILLAASCSGGSSGSSGSSNGSYVSNYDAPALETFHIDPVEPTLTQQEPQPEEQTAAAEETTAEEKEEATEDTGLTDKIYGLWYSNIPGDDHTVTVQKDGKILITFGEETAYLNYLNKDSNTIVSGEWEFTYSNETLLLFENGVQTEYAYVRTPPAAATDPATEPTPAPQTTTTDGAADYKELEHVLSQTSITEAQVSDMTILMKTTMVEAVEEELLSIIGDWNLYEDTVESFVDVSDAELAAWFEDARKENGMPTWKFQITGYTELPDKLQALQQRCAQRTTTGDGIYARAISQLLAADKMWVAHGQILRDDGITGYLELEGAMTVPLLIFRIDGRYYWQIDEIVGQ